MSYMLHATLPVTSALYVIAIPLKAHASVYSPKDHTVLLTKSGHFTTILRIIPAG